MNRISADAASRIKSYGNPDDRMLEILDILKEVDVVPDIGSLYTFVYSPKTPEIEYDQYPLVAVSDIFRWGFRGYNFHWKSDKSYSWESVKSNFYRVNKEELNDLIELRYGKYHLNSWYNKR